jgi:hypothetical protein
MIGDHTINSRLQRPTTPNHTQKPQRNHMIKLGYAALCQEPARQKRARGRY